MAFVGIKDVDVGSVRVALDQGCARVTRAFATAGDILIANSLRVHILYATIRYGCQEATATAWAVSHCEDQISPQTVDNEQTI